MKLSEGETHPFQVIKTTFVEGEGDFFVLRHKSGRRIMLPVLPYKNYNIECGKQIECRVDKVNCTGKVFLEPKHPLYEEGNFYSFRILSKVNEGNNIFIVVSDCFKNRIKIPSANNLDKREGEELILKVDRIKKGVPTFDFFAKNSKNNVSQNLVGASKKFIVVNVGIDSFGNDSFIIESNDGLKSYLTVKHYRYYGLFLGVEIECKIVGLKSDGSLEVEPHNPFYTMNNEYEFLINNSQPNDNDNESIVVTVVDSKGIKSNFIIQKNDFLQNKEKTRALCRVIGFRKGRPKLELVKLV